MEEEVDSSSDSEEEITVSAPEVPDQPDREWEPYPEAGVSHAVGIKQLAKGWKEEERTLERQSSLGIIIKRKKNKRRSKEGNGAELCRDFTILYSPCCTAGYRTPAAASYT